MFFCASSSRSPKDAASINEVDFLEASLEQQRDKKTASGRFGLFCDLCLRAMRVETGMEAMHLLLSSKRVTDDLVQAKEAQDQFGIPWDIKLVVRAWNSGVREDGEFRGFVNADGHLVALSQYNQYFFQPELWEHEETIRDNLIYFVETVVRPRLLGTQFLPCVLDLVILQDGGVHTPFSPHGRIQVVELNPANLRTSTALFCATDVFDGLIKENAFQELRLVKEFSRGEQVDLMRTLQSNLNEAHNRWKANELFRAAL